MVRCIDVSGKIDFFGCSTIVLLRCYCYAFTLLMFYTTALLFTKQFCNLLTIGVLLLSALLAYGRFLSNLQLSIHHENRKMPIQFERQTVRSE